MNREQRITLTRIIISAVMIAGLLIVNPQGVTRLVVYLALYLFIGYDILKEAAEGIVRGRVFDENFLMAIATVGAFALALYEGSGDYLEAVAVMFFYQIGEFFQSYAVGKSRRNISELMDIRPDYANVEQDGKIIRVSPEDVAVGQTIVVQPGEKVPIDGVVISGESSVDTSALSGESLPRDVKAGDEIISGSINISGVLNVRTTKEFGNSTVSKIMQLVEDSASRKSKSEDFIAKFARIYTPAVCYGALALALLPPLFLIVFAGETLSFATFGSWAYRALLFLVISCPCALVVSIPLSFFAGIGGASRSGVLVKGANILETLSKVKTVVFDKTGTLTKGVFEVIAYHDAEDRDIQSQKEQLLEYAAIAESSSSHPIAKSLQQAYGHTPERSRMGQIKEISGKGIIATIDGKSVAVGNEKLMLDYGITPCRCKKAGTIVHLSVEGKYLGHIVLGDVVKPEAAKAVADLHQVGITRTIMLTGDTKAVAEQTASALGIDQVYGELLPTDKVLQVEKIINSQTKTDKTAFVGDGINDAPVLSRADVGIAMGAMGSDA
ncbi:MAG: heavy metal translocating P-type ATPase, partial [Candidatus Onthomorpha sp.]|nr:heavy metal translocating P-type ATPase [Candidatus Onthomorpha sp.]